MCAAVLTSPFGSAHLGPPPTATRVGSSRSAAGNERGWACGRARPERRGSIGSLDDLARQNLAGRANDLYGDARLPALGRAVTPIPVPKRGPAVPAAAGGRGAYGRAPAPQPADRADGGSPSPEPQGLHRSGSRTRLVKALTSLSLRRGPPPHLTAPSPVADAASAAPSAQEGPAFFFESDEAYGVGPTRPGSAASGYLMARGSAFPEPLYDEQLYQPEAVLPAYSATATATATTTTTAAAVPLGRARCSYAPSARPLGRAPAPAPAPVPVPARTPAPPSPVPWDLPPRAASAYHRLLSTVPEPLLSSGAVQRQLARQAVLDSAPGINAVGWGPPASYAPRGGRGAAAAGRTAGGRGEREEWEEEEEREREWWAVGGPVGGPGRRGSWSLATWDGAR